MNAALDMVGEPGFVAGVAYGAAALLIGLPVGLAWRRWKAAPAPIGGLLLGMAVLLGLHHTVGFRREVAVSLLLMAAVGAVGQSALLPRWMWLVAAAPAGWLLAVHGGIVPVDWIRILVAVMASVGGIAVADFDERWRSAAAAPVLLAVSVVGVYYTVPDTEQALVLVGASLPLIVLAWPLPLVSLGGAGAMVASATVAWVVAVGGFGRQSSIIGGLACFGLLVLEPVTRLIRRHTWTRCVPSGLWATPTLAVLHLGFVLVASRVAGLRQPAPARPDRSLARGGVTEAVVIVAAAVAVTLLLALALHRSFGREDGIARSDRSTS